MENKNIPGPRKENIIMIFEVPYKEMKQYLDFKCGFVSCPGDSENKKEFCDYYDRLCPKFKKQMCLISPINTDTIKKNNFRG